MGETLLDGGWTAGDLTRFSLANLRTEKRKELLMGMQIRKDTTKQTKKTRWLKTSQKHKLITRGGRFNGRTNWMSSKTI